MAELAAVLPKEYEYLEVENSPELFQIRVKNITCADDANVCFLFDAVFSLL